MQIIDLGIKDYLETWDLQKELALKRADDSIEDTLIFVEHPAVYTEGRAKDSGLETNAPTSIKIPKLGSVSMVTVERGGKRTFHGPGQLVGYPIFKLTHHDLRKYLRDLERVLVNVISQETLLVAKPCPETLFLEPGQLQTGVWAGDRKLASIGIAIKQWVSYHGFAINISTDLRYFQAIEPCGFHGDVMTTLERELGGLGVDLSVIKSNIKRALAEGLSALSESYQEWDHSIARVESNSSIQRSF